MTKSAAFTTVELLVVLVLSGFIFTMTMLVTQIMQQQEQRQKVDYQEVLSATQLQSLLKKDAYQSKAMWVDQQELFFDCNNYGIKYQFNKQYICRSIIETTIHNDTFLLPTKALACKWQGIDIQTGRIDEATIKSAFFKQPFAIIITKQYDQKTLLESDIEHLK